MGWCARDTPAVAHLPLEVSCAGRDAASTPSLMMSGSRASLMPFSCGASDPRPSQAEMSSLVMYMTRRGCSPPFSPLSKADIRQE